MPESRRSQRTASVLADEGIGRYGSSWLPDVTVNPSDGGLTPLHDYHALLGLVLRPSKHGRG